MLPGAGNKAGKITDLRQPAVQAGRAKKRQTKSVVEGLWGKIKLSKEWRGTEVCLPLYFQIITDSQDVTDCTGR